MGEIAEGMEYIVKYVSGIRYASEPYGELTTAAIELKEKWGFGPIHFRDIEELNALP